MEIQNQNASTSSTSSSSPTDLARATSSASPPLGLAGPVAALALASAAISHLQEVHLQQSKQQHQQSQQQKPLLPTSDTLPAQELSPSSQQPQLQLIPHQQSAATTTMPTPLPSALVLPQLQQSSQQTPAQQCPNNNNNINNNNNVQKRPMNAFLMFCKKHRKLVKKRHPTLENRDITKILGDLWSKLDRTRKRSYIELARQYKEIYIKANPEFKWYKTIHQDQISAQQMLQHPAKSDAGDSNKRDNNNVLPNNNIQAPKPPKKRYLEKEYNHNKSTKDNDGLVMIFDQDNIGRAIEHALSDSIRPAPSDCPVDFSLNRTVEMTRQTIISNIIDMILPNSKDSDMTPTASSNTSSSSSSSSSSNSSTSSTSNSTNNNSSKNSNAITQPLMQPVPAVTASTSSGLMPILTSGPVATPSTSAVSSANSAPVTEFDLEKRLSELPSLELNDDEPQHDGLATLAEAAVAIQRDEHAMSK